MSTLKHQQEIVSIKKNIEIIINNQTEMKNTTTEMKNTLKEFNSRLEEAEDQQTGRQGGRIHLIRTTKREKNFKK